MFRKKIILLLSLGMLLTGCSQADTKEALDKDGMLMVSALENNTKEKKQYTVSYRDLCTTVTLSANIKNCYDTLIDAPSGYGSMTIRKLCVEDGSVVKAGDAILEIDRSYDAIHKKELELELERKQESYIYTCSEYEKELEAANKAAGADLLDAALTYKRNQIQYDYEVYKKEGYAPIEEIEEELDAYKAIDENPLLTIYSDCEGRITFSNLAYVGGNVAAGKNLASVTNDTMVIYLCGKNYDSLYMGKELEMKSEDGKVLKGIVLANDYELKNTKTDGAMIQVVSLNGSEDFLVSELPKQVSIETNPVSWKNVLTVETECIYRDSNNAKYVYRKKSDGDVKRAYISTSIELNGYTWVTDGLSDGDICIEK